MADESMSPAPPPTTRDPEAAWEDARRVESWAGEVRFNFFRIAALGAYYGHLLVRAFVLGDPASGGDYLKVVTLLVAAWLLLVMGMQRALSGRFYPAWLKFASVGADLLLVTVLLIATGGPKSPLALLYVLVVVSCALRLSLELVWAGTCGALVGYLSVVAWVIRLRPELRIGHTEQIIFMIGVLGSGILAGQLVRQARRLVGGAPAEIVEET